MSRRWDSGSLVLLIILLFLAARAGWCQETSQTPSQEQPPPANSVEKQAPAEQKKENSGPADSKRAEGEKAAETKITAEQAEQLFHDVDTILEFASKDTSLPRKHQVKRRLASRDEVVSYLKKNMAEDKDVQRLQRTELVLKKFGLLPRDFDLQTFLVSLLEEQVAGYYDAKSKTVNLLDWVIPDLQRPVLAHELTHALQDQSFGLDKWLKKGTADLDAKKKITPDDITSDENSEARQAVVEGQAMVVLLDYMLAPMHRTVADSPEIVNNLNEDMRVGTPDSVQYRNAPIFLKESLTFPYRYGVEFEAELLRAEGKEKAFGATFQNPPRTSREIMQPETYIRGEHLAPLPLPDFKSIFRDYDRFDLGAIGEFDVDVLAEQYAGEQVAHHVYPNWRGGYYYSVHVKGDPSGALGLVFVSRWASPRWAQQFAAIYARGIQQRYKKMAIASSSNLPSDLKTLESLGGDHTWTTEEGPVVVDVKGDTVLVTESLEAPISDQFRRTVLGTSTSPQP
ncbi:MAG: hypothetical protein JOZ14_01495 [Acidobacteria bacterium]|nr:hypothetical protein [Acidobacteriota bacterium]